MKNSIKKYSKKTGNDDNISMIPEKGSENEDQKYKDNKYIESEETISLKKYNYKNKDDEKNDSEILIDDSRIDKLIKKIKEEENMLDDKNKIINDLKKEIEEKDNIIKKITKINNKLQKKLNDFSKQIDDKLNNNKDIYKIKIKNKSNIKTNFNNDELSKKELNNAMNVIKILQKDNNRLQSTIDKYEKINKLKEIENINKIKSDENVELEKKIKILKKELNNYNLCLKKCKLYEIQINTLIKDNKNLKDNIKLLNSKLNKKTIEENEKEKEKENRKFDYGTPQKNKSFLIKLDNSPYNNNRNKISLKLNHKTIQSNLSSLPKINSINKTPFKSNSNIKINNIVKKGDENSSQILKIYFNEEEIKIIEHIFKNNLNELEAFKKKMCIIHNSKEALKNKFNLEIRKYNERIKSAQEQIDYLNNKIRESEVNYRVLQTQLNEFNIQKKLFQKKIRILQSDLAQKDNILKANLVDFSLIDKREANMKNNNNNANNNNRIADDNGLSNIINAELNNNEVDNGKNSQNEKESNDSSFI